MPTTKTITLYQFAELPTEKARMKAIAWFLEDYPDHDWFDSIYDDFDTVASLMGIEVKAKNFSGFCSQGDGARFSGFWKPNGCEYVKAVKGYAPLDQKLLSIATKLEALQKANNCDLWAKISFMSSHYVHSNTMQIDTYDGEGEPVSLELDQEVQDTMRALANWLYRQLEAEYEYLTSTDHAMETIESNEYTFRADGTREDA